MQIEMLDTLEDRMAALAEKQLTVIEAFGIIQTYYPTLSSHDLTVLRDIVQRAQGNIRHELSKLVQENESKNSNRLMDSTRSPIPSQHNNTNPELNPTTRDSSI